MPPVDPDDLLNRLRRTADQFHSLTELEERLRSGRQLRIKYGVDATAPFLHIGHGVNLWMMRHLQEAGHKVVFLLGDFTTRIGDPTGKSQTRPVLTEAEIDRNAQAFLDQVGAILLEDPEVFEVRRNSEWFGEMDLAEFLGLASSVTHAHLISRDTFRQRIAAGSPIHLHELVYPVLQGYDSAMLDSDLTIVGTDQLFNEMMGRYFQQRMGQDPQVVITSRITPGTDGREKQSKSLGNYIALADSPRDKFGKAMSIPDELILPYLEVYTDEPLDGLAERAADQPFATKKLLAASLVRRYHGPETASEELAWFERTFSKRQVPTDIAEVAIGDGATVLDAARAVRPGDSNRRLREIITGGGFRVGETRLTDPEAAAPVGEVVQLGKRTWVKLVAGGPDQG
jgi:tyrosyl-tRNA synthetase